MRRVRIGVALVLAAMGAAAVSLHALEQAGGVAVESPTGFADPGRPAKLARVFPELDRAFADFAARAHVPGIAYGVVIDGRLVHTMTFGHRAVDPAAPVEAATVFRIASMTKSFTAISVLRLRDEGKLSLDDPAERYVPELQGLTYPTADSPRITIRHLLSHAEGFPEDNPWGDRQLAVTDAQMTAMLREGIPFSNPPGLAYEYSNYGFAILGRIVANVSGMPYREYVTARILRPLGLTSTTMEVGEVPAARLAHGYRWEDDRWKEEPQLADGAFGSMGGMLTSVEDLGRYVGFLLSAWPPRDEPDAGPLRRASLREMQQVSRLAPAAAARTSDGRIRMNAGGYAFGLRVYQTCDFGHVVAHGGGLPGFGSYMRWLPEYGVGIIALGNLTYTGWSGVTDQALAALLGTGALRPHVTRPSQALIEARDAVTSLIGRWDDQLAAVNLFLDTSRDRRKRALDDLRARVGTCRPEGDFDVENALRGQWTLACEHGWLSVAVSLATTMPPKVQYLSVSPVAPGVRPRTGACQ
jgi:CubicO group peptidase (beta-lactamase class C family)